MAYAAANLQPAGGQGRKGKAPQIWTYNTLDAAATVDSAGYFNSGTAYAGAYNLLEIGDLIYRVTWSTAIGTGGTFSTAGLHVVTGKASGTVDVTDATALGGTDTD